MCCLLYIDEIVNSLECLKIKFENFEKRESQPVETRKFSIIYVSRINLGVFSSRMPHSNASLLHSCNVNPRCLIQCNMEKLFVFN